MSKIETKNLVIAVTDNGDPSVGILSQTYLVECPFENGDFSPDEINFFIGQLRKLYGEFAQGKITTFIHN